MLWEEINAFIHPSSSPLSPIHLTSPLSPILQFSNSPILVVCSFHSSISYWIFGNSRNGNSLWYCLSPLSFVVCSVIHSIECTDELNSFSLNRRMEKGNSLPLFPKNLKGFREMKMKRMGGKLLSFTLLLLSKSNSSLTAFSFYGRLLKSIFKFKLTVSPFFSVTKKRELEADTPTVRDKS